MSSLVIEKPDKGDTFLYLMLPLALSGLVASTQLFPVGVLVSADAYTIAFGSLTLYVLQPDLRYLRRRMCDRLLKEFGYVLEDWMLLVQLATANWFTQLDSPPALTDEDGHSPHGMHCVETGVAAVARSRVAANILWNLRVELFFAVSLLILVPTSVLLAMVLIGDLVPPRMLGSALIVRVIAYCAAASIPTLVLLVVAKKYEKDSKDALEHLAGLAGALWLMDFMATADISGYEKWPKTALNLVRPHLESARQIIQMGDWKWFCLLWQSIVDALPSAVRMQMGSITTLCRELWADCISGTANYVTCIQIRWMLHLLFHRNELVELGLQQTIQDLAEIADRKPVCLQNLATVVGLFPEALFDSAASGDKTTLAARFLAKVLGLTLGPKKDVDLVEGMVLLVQSIESGQWSPHTDDTAAVIQTAAKLVTRFVEQSPSYPRSGLWTSQMRKVDPGNPHVKAGRCIALLKALPDSTNRVPLLLSFAAEVGDRQIIAEVLSDRMAVRNEEMASHEFVQILKGLPSTSNDEDDRRGRLQIEELYRNRGLTY